MNKPQQRSGTPSWSVILLGAFAVLGAVVLLQWFLNWLVGWFKLIVLVVVIVAVAMWVVSAKASRR